MDKSICFSVLELSGKDNKESVHLKHNINIWTATGQKWYSNLWMWNSFLVKSGTVDYLSLLIQIKLVESFNSRIKINIWWNKNIKHWKGRNKVIIIGRLCDYQEILRSTKKYLTVLVLQSDTRSITKFCSFNKY